MDKKSIRTGIIIAAVIVITAALFFTAGSVREHIKAKNAYKLAESYVKHGEYDRAMGILDSLIVDRVGDKKAVSMIDKIIYLKNSDATYEEVFSPDFKLEDLPEEERNRVRKNSSSGSDNGNNRNRTGGNYDEYSDRQNDERTRELAGRDLTISVDTSELSEGISSAFESTLSSMRSALEESSKQANENQKAMENLLKMQQEQSVENERKNQEQLRKLEEQRQLEEKRRIEENERIEKQKLAEEEKKRREAEEQKKKAEIEKKNAENKKTMDEVDGELRLGKAALAMGNYEEAIKHFNAADSKSGTVDASYKAMMDSKIASSMYEAALKSQDKDEIKRLKLEAVELAQKAVEVNPSDAAAYYILAQDAVDKKDYEKACANLKKAILNNPDEFMYYYDLGKNSYLLKKYSEAVSAFSTACEKNKTYAPARYNLGLAYKQLKNETAALEAFRKTLDIDPRHEKALMEEGRLLNARGDYAGAADSYEKLLKINSMNVQAAMQLGSAYRQLGNLAKAENAYKKALTMLDGGENQILTKYNLSTVLFDEKKVQDAEKYASEAYNELASTEKNMTSYAVNITYNYALILDSEGKIDEALPKYMEVLSLEPDHEKTRINLGVMYMTLDPPDVEMALKMFIQVYNKNKDNFEANNNLGSVYALKEDYDNAIKFYKNALRLEPKSNDIRTNLGKAYAKNAQYDLAKVTFGEVLRADPDYYEVYIELARVCIQLGDNAAAEKNLLILQARKSDYKASEVQSLLDSI